MNRTILKMRFILISGLICLIAGGGSAGADDVVNFQTIPGALPAQLDTDDDAKLSQMSRRALDAALRARQAYFKQAGLDALAKQALDSPGPAPAASPPDTGLAADLLEAGLTSIAGTSDEPTGEVTLPVDLSQSCPGFYILRTHPGANSQSGRIGAEILLAGSGLRTLQGGLNFGGQATSSIRGFAAFSIANANDENQVVNIGLDADASGRLVLERRSGGTATILVDQAVAAGETDVSATVSPGFYVVGFKPDRSEPTNYSVAALTSFPNRAGGGFQGGVVFGGYHNPARESTGFGGFCIAESFDVSVSVLSQPTYGSSGAQRLAFSVSSGDGTVYLDSRTPEGPEGVQRPSLVEAVAADTQTASISWLPAQAPQVSPGNIDYRLHMANSSGFTPSGATERLTVRRQTSVALTGLQAGSEQYVKVEAWAGGESLGWSNELLLAVPSIDPVIRADRTIWVLDQSNVEDLEIQAGRISYRRLDSSLAPGSGDLVVSALQDGLTRTVTSVSSSGGRQVLNTETEDAPLEAIFEQAHIRNSFNLADIEDSSRGDDSQIQTIRRESDGRLVRRATWPASGMTLVQEGAQSDSIDVVLQSVDGSGLKSAGVVPRVNQDASEGRIENKTFFNAVAAQWPTTVSVFPGEPFTFDTDVNTVTGDYRLRSFQLSSITPPRGRDAVPISIRQVTQTTQTRAAAVTVSPERRHADDEGRPHVVRFQAVAEQVDNCPFWGCRTREVEFEVEVYVGTQLGGASIDWDIGAPDGSIRLRGDFTVDLEPDVRMEVDRRGFGVDYAAFSVAAKPISFKLNARLDAAASGQYQGRVEDIFKKRFWKVILAGNVPILISGTLSLDAQLTLDASAEMDLEHQLELSYELEKGVEYIRGQGYRVISPQVEPEESYALSGQATGRAGLDMRLIPRLDVGIYEFAFGRSKIEPYLAASTELEGSFSRSSNGIFDDQNFKFTELHAGVGLDVGLRFDAGIADTTIVGWPSRDPDDFWTTALIPEFTLVDLPEISLSLDESARLPGRPQARRVVASIANTSPLHSWVAQSAEWSMRPGDSAVLRRSPLGLPNEVWIEPDGIVGDFGVRFSGHGALGAYLRQSEMFSISSNTWPNLSVNTVSAGGDHSCALMISGEILCWGGGSLSPSNVGRPGENFVDVSSDGETTCGVHSNGEFSCWKSRDWSVIRDQIRFDSNSRSIGLGRFHSCTSVDTGGVYCWGSNGHGRIGDGTNRGPVWPPKRVLDLDNHIRKVSLANIHSCALTNGGEVKCWGGNSEGRLGDGTKINRYSPVKFGTFDDVVDVGAGGSLTCVVVSSGEVFCTGFLGTTTGFRYGPEPRKIDAEKPAIRVAVGDSHSCLLYNDGTIGCWGFNRHYQLGTDGRFSGKADPVLVNGIEGATGISAGTSHTCATLSSGEIKCWGGNSSGQLGDGRLEDSFLPVSVHLFGNARNPDLSIASIAALSDRVTPGELVSFELRVENVGSQVTSEAELRYFFGSNWGVIDIPILQPGETWNGGVSIQAPSSQGVYSLSGTLTELPNEISYSNNRAKSGSVAVGGEFRQWGCDVTVEAGRDETSINVHQLGQNSGTFDLDYELFSIKDQISVYYEGNLILFTGCTNGSRNRTVNFSGQSSEVWIYVQGQCDSDDVGQTDWNYQAHCPD